MILERGIAPESKEIDHINLIRPEQIKLDNGCNIFSFNSGDQELLRIEWIFANLRFDPSKPLLNVAVNTMLTEGTSKLTAAQIADKVDYYGAFLQVDYGYDHSQVVLYTLNKHLAATLPVIKDIITNSIFPAKELKTFIRNQQQKLQVSLQKNDVLARRAFNKAMYGDTLYGLSANFEDYKTLQREDMVAHFKQMYQPSNCTMLVAGKVDAAALALLTTAFGNEWSNHTISADSGQPALKPADGHLYFVEKPEALQSAIRMGLPSITRVHPDFPALQVMNTVLGGYFGSRLMNNIREDKGYTYGIGSGISSLNRGGALFIATEVGADVCKAAMIEIEKEVNLLKAEPVPKAELSLVRNYMLGSLLGSLENVMSHADKFKNIYFAGLGYEYYDRYTEVIRSIAPEQVQQIANKYLDMHQFYKVIIGQC